MMEGYNNIKEIEDMVNKNLIPHLNLRDKYIEITPNYEHNYDDKTDDFSVNENKIVSYNFALMSKQLGGLIDNIVVSEQGLNMDNIPPMLNVLTKDNCHKEMLFHRDILTSKFKLLDDEYMTISDALIKARNYGDDYKLEDIHKLSELSNSILERYNIENDDYLHSIYKSEITDIKAMPYLYASLGIDNLMEDSNVYGNIGQIIYEIKKEEFKGCEREYTDGNNYEHLTVLQENDDLVFSYEKLDGETISSANFILGIDSLEKNILEDTFDGENYDKMQKNFENAVNSGIYYNLMEEPMLQIEELSVKPKNLVKESMKDDR